MQDQELFTSRIDLKPLSQAVERIREEVGKIVVGQREMIDLIVAAILGNGHVLIEGVPGIAKTLTAKLVAIQRQLGAGVAR